MVKGNDKNKGGRSVYWMEQGQHVIYVVTGWAFLCVGIALLGFGGVKFIEELHTDYMHAFYLIINDLMLVLIIMESMETIVHYLKYQTIALKPFLHMGMIAAVRKILGAGAKVILAEDLTQPVFDRYLMDIGVNALVILALAISLSLLNKSEIPSRRKEPHEGTSVL